MYLKSNHIPVKLLCKSKSSKFKITSQTQVRTQNKIKVKQRYLNQGQTSKRPHGYKIKLSTINQNFEIDDKQFVNCIKKQKYNIKSGYIHKIKHNTNLKHRITQSNQQTYSNTQRLEITNSNNQSQVDLSTNNQDKQLKTKSNTSLKVLQSIQKADGLRLSLFRTKKLRQKYSQIAFVDLIQSKPLNTQQNKLSCRWNKIKMQKNQETQLRKDQSTKQINQRELLKINKEEIINKSIGKVDTQQTISEFNESSYLKIKLNQQQPQVESRERFFKQRQSNSLQNSNQIKQREIVSQAIIELDQRNSNCNIHSRKGFQTSRMMKNRDIHSNRSVGKQGQEEQLLERINRRQKQNSVNVSFSKIINRNKDIVSILKEFNQDNKLSQTRNTTMTTINKIKRLPFSSSNSKFQSLLTPEMQKIRTKSKSHRNSQYLHSIEKPNSYKLRYICIDRKLNFKNRYQQEKQPYPLTQR